MIEMKRQIKPVTVENRSTFDDIVKSYIVSCIDCRNPFTGSGHSFPNIFKMEK